MPRPIPNRKKRTTARNSSPAPILRNETLDLFDGVRVTWPEIAAWCLAVAGIGPESWRFAYYAENWNVADKVRRAKLAGSWPPSTIQN